MTNLSKLCNYIESLKFDDLPECVKDYTSLLIADHYISAIAGFINNKEFNDIIRRIIEEEFGTGNCSVLFSDKKLTASGASFINAVYCHGADIDDGHREAEAHPGVAVIASVLSLSEELQKDGQAVICAVVAGYEMFVRVAKTILPNHLYRGFHTTSTVGAIASAVACAKLMGLDAMRIEKAISLAATQSSGLLCVCESGQAAKPINPGRAAQVGVMCSKLAMLDSPAPLDVFDCKLGFINAFSDDNKSFYLIEELGEKYHILDTYVKLYPSCRHTHATIEALKKYVKKHGTINRNKKINIFTYPIAVDIVGHNRKPTTIGDVKFSIPYTAACVAMFGDYSINNLKNFKEEAPVVLEYINNIKVMSDSQYDNPKEGVRGARIEIVYEDGKIDEECVKIARGEGDDRIDWSTLKEKAISCCGEYVDIKTINNILDYCKRMNNEAFFTHPFISCRNYEVY